MLYIIQLRKEIQNIKIRLVKAKQRNTYGYDFNVVVIIVDHTFITSTYIMHNRRFNNITFIHT